MSRPAERLRRSGASWLLLLLGAVAAAAMVPQFAVFIPIVAVAWLVARLGLLPAFVRHRHPGARLASGVDAPVTWLVATLESEPGRARSEQELLAALLARADAVAGDRLPTGSAHVVAWAPTPPPNAPDPESLQDVLASWPDLREPLSRGARLAACTRASSAGRHRRIEACLVGDKDLLGRLALAAASDWRGRDIEVVTTGWLRHAERLQASRPRGRA